MAGLAVRGKRTATGGLCDSGALLQELSLRQVLKWPVDGLTLKVAGGDGQLASCEKASAARCDEQLETLIELLQTLLGIVETQRPAAGSKRMVVEAQLEASDAGHVYGLTPREEEVLTEMIDGKSSRQIAVALTVTVSTIKSHVSSILAKMGAESRTEAVALALQQQNEIDCGCLFCGETRPDCLRQLSG